MNSVAQLSSDLFSYCIVFATAWPPCGLQFKQITSSTAENPPAVTLQKSIIFFLSQIKLIKLPIQSTLLFLTVAHLQSTQFYPMNYTQTLTWAFLFSLKPDSSLITVWTTCFFSPGYKYVYKLRLHCRSGVDLSLILKKTFSQPFRNTLSWMCYIVTFHILYSFGTLWWDRNDPKANPASILQLSIVLNPLKILKMAIIINHLTYSVNK